MVYSRRVFVLFVRNLHSSISRFHRDWEWPRRDVKKKKKNAKNFHEYFSSMQWRYGLPLHLIKIWNKSILVIFHRCSRLICLKAKNTPCCIGLIWVDWRCKILRINKNRTKKKHIETKNIIRVEMYESHHRANWNSYARIFRIKRMVSLAPSSKKTTCR